MSNTALDILLEGLFDYSGMFPPEAKTFEGALADSAAFSQTLTRPYLVSADMVLTLESIQLLTEKARAAFGRNEMKIALLGSELTAHSQNLTSEYEMISSFNASNSNAPLRTVIGSYEIKVGTCSDEILATLFPLISNFESCGVNVAIEPDLSKEDWRDVLSRAVAFCSQFKDALSLKFRGTGPTGVGNDKIAFVLAHVADASIHAKATGGLHHPFLEERYGNNLGFLGLVAALYLRRGLGEKFTIDDIMRCLCSSDPSDMELEVALGWQHHSISLDALKKLKHSYRFSIGSCSIHEPDSDLVRIFG